MASNHSTESCSNVPPALLAGFFVEALLNAVVPLKASPSPSSRIHFSLVCLTFFCCFTLLKQLVSTSHAYLFVINLVCPFKVKTQNSTLPVCRILLCDNLLPQGIQQTKNNYLLLVCFHFVWLIAYVYSLGLSAVPVNISQIQCPTSNVLRFRGIYYQKLSIIFITVFSLVCNHLKIRPLCCSAMFLQ